MSQNPSRRARRNRLPLATGILLASLQYLAGSVVAQPANDRCDEAIPVIEGVSVQGSTDGADDTLFGCGWQDVWYRFTPERTAVYEIDVCGAEFESVISVHFNCDGPSVACVWSTCPNGGARLVMYGEAGREYLIAIGGFQFETGPFTLRVNPLPPANDACADAEPLILDTTTYGYTLDASQDGPTGCGEGRGDVWYSFTPESSGAYSFGTCAPYTDHETEISILDGCGGAVLACRTDEGTCGGKAEIVAALEGGRSYRVRVAGKEDSRGLFALTARSLGIGPVESEGFQTILMESESAALVPIHVEDLVGHVNAGADLRVRIPFSLGFVFDPVGSSVALGGSAAGKIAGPPSFVDGGRTALFDVIETFSPGDELTIDGLAVRNIVREAAPASLLVDVGSPYGILRDAFTKQVDRLGTYVTSGDNQDEYDRGRPDGDFDACLFNFSPESPIELTIRNPGPPPAREATLVIGSNDVDFDCDTLPERACQLDRAYLNGNFMGVLTGITDTDGAVILRVPNIEWVLPGRNEVRIDIDTDPDAGDWCLEVQYAHLLVDGGTTGLVGISAFRTDKEKYVFGETVRIDYELDVPGGGSRTLRVNTAVISPTDTLVSIDNRVLTITGTVPEPQTVDLRIPTDGEFGAYKARIVVLDDASEQFEALGTLRIYVGDSPTVDQVTFSPGLLLSGDPSGTTLSALVDDPQGLEDIASVAADLSILGGVASQPLFDDGSNGDAAAGDGIYTFGPIFTENPSELYPVIVTAIDRSGLEASKAGNLLVTGNGAPRVQDVRFQPNAIYRDGIESARLTARVSDPEGLGDVVSVLADLRVLGGTPTPMRDDGTGGDLAAGDGVFTLSGVTTEVLGGFYDIEVLAVDMTALEGRGTGPLRVVDNRPPQIHEVTFDPPAILNDGVASTRLAARASDPEGLDDLSTVTADLSPLGGGRVVLRDDGLAGDATAGDGIFTHSGIAVSPGLEIGPRSIVVTAHDRDDERASGAGQLVVQRLPTLARLANISTRGRVGADDDVMIAGVIVGGTEPRDVLIGGIGPDLINFGIQGTLANPSLTLYRAGEVLAENDNWESAPNASAIRASGRAPNNELEAAILRSLEPGEYTAILRGFNRGTGVGLVQAFDLGGGDGRFVNLSTRLPVGTGQNVLIGGFIVEGETPLLVVVRALGPTLGAPPFNVPGTLADPEVALVSGSTLLASNGDWRDGPRAAELEERGFEPASDREPAILIELQPGAYTAIVSGAGGSTGNALVEVYEAEPPIAVPE